MDEKQFKELEAKIGTSMATMFSEKTDEMRAGLLTEDQLKTELEAFAKSEDTDEINKTIDTKIEEVLVEMKKQKKLEDEAKPKSLHEQIAEKHDDLKNAISEKKAFTMDIKTCTVNCHRVC